MLTKSIPRYLLLFGTFLFSAAGSASVSLRSPVKYTVGTNPRAVAVGDFNGDGKADVAVVNAGESTTNDPGGISILLGNGDGTFKPAINFSAGNNPGVVAVGDFDGDGKDDLAVLGLGVTIFLGNADGTFRQGQQILTFSNPAALVAADFNSDGAIDLAVADASSITIMLGNGDGTFQSVANYPNITRSLFVLDLNRDGKKDLGITFDRNSLERNAIGVLLGNGDGTFQPLSTLGGWLISPSFSADFNHDGNVDIIVSGCNPFSGNCGESLSLTSPDGSLSEPPGTNVLTNGADIVGDFDGDGNLDLAGPASDGSPALVMFAGNGDGSFQQPVTISATDFSSVVVTLVADLNNDKAPDLVTISGLAGTNTISVMLNAGTDFSMSVSAFSPSSIAAGQSASSTLSLQLLNLFNNPVALSCSVQPAQAGAPTCSLNASSVTFDSSGKASATLKVSTGSFALLKNREPMNPGTPMWVPMAGVALLGTGFSSRVRKRMLLAILSFAVLLGLISVHACGGGSGGPKSTNYAITITGTSGQTTHSSTVNVTVQ